MNYVVPTGVTQTEVTPITDGPTGPTSLVESGGGTLILTGDNTYTGYTEVQAGVLAVGLDPTTNLNGSIADSAYLQVDAGATFQIYNATAPVAVNGLQGAGNVSLGMNSLVDTQGLTGATNFSGQILGEGGLVVSALPGASAGAATLELTGDSTYTGVTTINAGATLQIGDGGSGGAIMYSSSIVGAGTLVFDTASSNDLYYGSDATVVQEGTGTLTINQGVSLVKVVSGTVDLNGSGSAEVGQGVLYVEGPPSMQIGDEYEESISYVQLSDLTSTSHGTVYFTNLVLFTDPVFSGQFAGNSDLFIADGGVLSGSSTFVGNVYLESGYLQLTTSQALGQSSNAIYLSGSTDLYPGSFAPRENTQFATLAFGNALLSNGAFGHAVSADVNDAEIDLTGLAYTAGATATGSNYSSATNSWGTLSVTSGGVTDTLTGAFQDALTDQYFVQPDGHGGVEVVIADYIAPISTQAALDQALQDFSLYAQDGGNFQPTLATNVSLSGTTTAEIAAGDRVVIDQQGYDLLDPSGTLVIGSTAGNTYGNFTGTLALGYSSTGPAAANSFGGVSIVSGLLELVSAGAVGSAPITFAEPASTYAIGNYSVYDNALGEPQTGIQLDQVNGQTIALPNTLYGFSVGDAIILAGEPIASLSLGAGNLLSVTEQGGAVVALHLDPSQSFVGESFGYIDTAAGGEVGLFVPQLYTTPTSLTEYATATGSALTNATDYNPQSPGLSVASVSSGYSGASKTVGSGQTTLQGAYGVLTITSGGAYSYTTDVEGLTVGAVYVDTFIATVADGLGGQASESLSFTVTGSATGTAANNIIVGGSGAAETITGLGGSDLLIAGSAPDTFAYTAASDSPYSTTGTPTFDAIQGFRSGTDHIDVSAADGGGVELVREDTGGAAQTFVYFDPGGPAGYQAVVDVYGVVQPGDLVTSGAVSYVYDYGDKATGQVLDGTSGHDFLVSGGAASDTLLGGPGDVMYGGAGVDDFVIGSLAASPTAGAFDVIADFTSGQDKLDLSAVDGVGVEIAYYHGDAFVYFAPASGSFTGVVEVLGSITPDDLILSAAARSNGVVIQGDTTLPVTASETLRGGSNGDFIYGGSAHDTIIGGGGADFLIGGTGADTFAYIAISDSTPTAQDTISNFDPAKGDIIDVSALDSAASVQGSFVSAFDGHAGEYILTAPTGSGSYWSLQGDLTGSGHADFQLAFAVAGAITDYQDVQAHIHL